MKRWGKYAKPYLKFFIIGPVCMIVEVIGEVIMPKMLSAIIQYGINETPADGFFGWLYGLFGTNWGFVLAIMAGMLLTAVLMMIGGIGGAYFGAKAAVNFGADLRQDVYNKIQKFSFSNIDKYSSGSLVTRLTNDVTQMTNFVNMLLRLALRAPGMLIGALIMAILTSPSLSVVLSVSIPLLILTIVLFIVKAYPRFTKMQGKIDALNTTVQEDITNIRVVKSFVREEHEKDKFAKSNKDLKKTGIGAMNIMVLMMPGMTFFMNATVIAVFWFGGRMVVGGALPDADLIAFVTYVTQILTSLMMVTMLFMMFSRALASAKRVGEVLDEKIDITDENCARPEKTVEIGDIEFRNVSFRYFENSEEKVLDNINLKIKHGSTVGIIGSTGCGKTTLVSMIPRLYDVDDGEVLVDGVNVRDYSLYNLREGVGMVLQKNVLFSGTIAENLRWGNENATDDELTEVSEYAQANKFINNFTDGYKTDLGQGGSNVSGGQKQRLCIARALLKNPKVLILDDSTSAVDTATETQIRRAFSEKMSGSTKIIIAQRISSVRDADEIIVMNDGRITGIGTHEELLESNTEYQEIFYSQTDKREA